MGVVSGPLAASAQRDANKKNRKSAKETNAQNYRIFNEGRGSKGSSLFPIYAKAFEKDYADAIAEGFNAPSRDIGEYRDAASKFKEMRDRSKSFATGIFDGSTTTERLNNFAPVKEARVSYRKQASVDAFNRTMSDIEAEQARGGFTGGDSSSNQNLRFRAAKSAGDDLAATNIQNVEEERGIRDAGIDLQLSNLGLPTQLAASDLALLAAPDNAYTDALSRRIALTNGLRIGPGSFQVAPLPQEQPNIGVLGAALQGAGQTGATLYGAYQQNKQANMYRDALASRGYQPTADGGFSGLTKSYGGEAYRSVKTPTGGFSAPVDGSVGDGGFWSGVGNFFGF